MNIYTTGLFSNSSAGLYQSSQRLASGLRVNSAADDAAANAIGNNLSKQISGQSQALRNMSDGISLIETHTGALSEVSSLYNRARGLAIQASNGTLSSTDRASLNTEYTQIMQQADDIFSSTTFNGQSLFQNGGAPTTVDIQSGEGTGNTSAINSVDYSTISGTTLPTNILTQGNAQAAIGALDTAIDNTTLASSELGAVHNGLATTYSGVESNVLQTQIARGRVLDADYAKETTELAKYQLLQTANFAMHKKINESKALMLNLLNQ